MRTEIAAPSDDFPPEIARVLRAGLADRLRSSNPIFLDSFTPDAVFEFPFAPDPAGRRVVGRNAAHAFYARLNRAMALEAAALDKAYFADGADAILEYHAVARDLRTGRTAPQQFIAIVQLRDGCIAFLREYFGPPPLSLANP